MRAMELVEVLCAAHLGRMVAGPFNERGGMMLIGPPGVLKTTFVSVLDTTYQDAIMVSDINVKSLVRMRDAIASGKVNTLVLPEYAKVYERADVTAKNIEGTLRAMTAEGFAAASFEDSRVNRLTARAFVVGALTPAMIDRHFQDWEDSGFNRRFLWVLIKLDNPHALEQAAINWTRIDFRMKHVPLPPLGGSSIPNLTTVRERQRLSAMVKYQPGGDHAIQLQLMIRIAAVLHWWYRESGDPRNPMDTVESFAPGLGKTGVELKLDEVEEVDAALDLAREMRNAASQLARKRWSGTHSENGKKKKAKKK